jgi:hypothetical protein
MGRQWRKVVASLFGLSCAVYGKSVPGPARAEAEVLLEVLELGTAVVPALLRIRRFSCSGFGHLNTRGQEAYCCESKKVQNLSFVQPCAKRRHATEISFSEPNCVARQGRFIAPV